MVDFEILGGDTFRRLRLDNLEVDIVGFGNRKDGDRPRVGLGKRRSQYGGRKPCGVQNQAFLTE